MPINPKLKVPLIFVACVLALGILSALFATMGYFGLRAISMVGKTTPRTQERTTTVQPPSLEGSTLRATNQACKIVVPEGWKSVNALNKDAVISAGNVTDGEYFMVICDPKDAVFSSVDLYADTVSQAMVKRLQNGSREEATHFQLNGLSAIRYILTGSYSNYDFVYSLTCVQGSRYRYQLLGWTFKNRRGIAELRLNHIGETWAEEE
jgi:hypothetical protein